MRLTLKAARINSGLTQKQAAEKFGVSKETIGNWEAGKSLPNISKAKMIEKVYGIGYDDIIFFTA